MSDKKKKMLAIGIGSILMLLLYVIIVIYVNNISKKEAPLKKMEDDWNCITSILLKNSESYSTYYDNAKNNVYVLSASHNITDDMRGNALTFSTYAAYVDVYISEKINASDENTDIFSSDNKYNSTERIYHFGKEGRLDVTSGKYIHIIDIPDNAKGSVTVRIETSYKNDFVNEGNIYIGSRNSIVYNFLHKELVRVFLYNLFLFAGIVLLVFYFMGRKEENDKRYILYLGLLFVMTVIHFSSKLFFLQYVIKNPIIHYYSKYFTMLILPILIIALIGNVFKSFRLKAEICIVTGIAIILTVLHFLGLVLFTGSDGIYGGCLLLILVEILIRAAKKLKEYRREFENEEA